MISSPFQFQKSPLPPREGIHPVKYDHLPKLILNHATIEKD
jgi:hypothetical protein